MLRRWAPLLAPLLVLLVYVRTLGAPFAWDDRHLILDSPSVTALQPLGSYFGHAFWTSPETGDLRGYYRPLTILSFALEYHVHGANPAPLHLTNLLLHALDVVLLYLLLRRFRVAPLVGLLLCLLWGLHPRLTEAVAWISGRTDVLATTWVLAALLAYRPHKPGRVVAASLLMFLGLLSKEVAVAGIVALVVTELAPPSRRGAEPMPLGKRAALAAIPLATLAAYLVLRGRALSGASASASLLDLGAGKRAMLALAALGEYARMLVIPWRPQLQIGDVWDPRPLSIALGASALLALGPLGYRLRGLWLEPRANVRPLVVLGSCLALGGIGLVLHLIPIAVNVVAADRFLYLPLAGVALALAPCLQSWALGSPRKLAFCAALAVTFFGATYVRAGDWCSELQLWSKTYRDAPKRNGLPANELGNVYYRAGLFDEAAAIYAQAERNHAREESPWANHADAVSQLGDYDAAQRELSGLCERYPKIAEYCLDAGLVELHRLRFDAARSFIRTALARASDYPAATAALDATARTEALARAPDYDSSDPLTRIATRFEVAQLAGRRPDALRLGEALLALPDAPRPLRREAAEYWARFGPPGELRRVLGAATAADVVDAPMLEVVDLRVRTADELMSAWASLGIPKSGT